MCLREKMATSECVQSGNLGQDLYQELSSSKVLVVGAGGIGCELLKTLVLTGFSDIVVIDLDTIDVSNLNRQFLFQKQHVGKSKASVARESAIQFNPNAQIKAYHDSITSPDYDVDFFRQFSVVLNALDNRAARNHVNRMCLATNVPLVESGSAGYLGQVTVIQKGQTECYECQPKPHQKSYPGCTIRNTPSEPIHCIVWAKHLFNQLFGEADADEEVSPDTEDPEAGGIAGERATSTTTGDELQRTSTQEWAKKIDYDPVKLVNKLFVEDVKYLLSMDKLWKDRKPPVPLDLWNLAEEVIPNDTLCLSDQKIWSIKECIKKFNDCVNNLKMELSKKGDYLVWDKDDKASLDFVVSACNIRAHIFTIQRKSRFDVKSMAGNIIPAIATTNAVISGLIVLEAMKVLDRKMETCRTTYLNKMPSIRKKLLQPSKLVAPNPKCYVCSSKPEATVMMDCSKITLKVFEEKLLKQEFGVIAPDVEIDDGKGTILISSEEGETDHNHTKLLKDFKIGNGSRLKVDDFLQNYELVVNIQQCDNMADEEEFKIVQDIEKRAESPEDNDMDVSTLNDTDIKIVERKREARESLDDEKTSQTMANNPKDNGKVVERKRKASQSIDDEQTTKTLKQARVDVDGFVGKSRTNGQTELTNKNAECVVMVIDDDDNDDDITASKPGIDLKSKSIQNVNKDINGSSNPVVVINLDDDDNDDVDSQKHSYNGCRETKHVSNIVIDDKDNCENDVIIL